MPWLDDCGRDPSTGLGSGHSAVKSSQPTGPVFVPLIAQKVKLLLCAYLDPKEML